MFERFYLPQLYRLILVVVLFAVGMLLVGCQATATLLSSSATPGPPTPTTARDTTPATISPEPSLTPARASSLAAATLTPTPPETRLPPQFGYTHLRPDGNRLLVGQGRLPEIKPIDITLAGPPQWLVAAPLGQNASAWVAVLRDGRTEGFIISSGGVVTPTAVTPAQLPSTMPPLLRVEQGGLSLVTPPTAAASLQTHPIFLPPTDTKVSVQANGDLLFGDNPDLGSVTVSALPDARLLRDGTGRLLLYTNPTSRYAHGVLGDALEAGGITLIETQPEPRVAAVIPIPEPSVGEGIAPIWADLTGDGEREIIVTLSNADQGAQIVLFDQIGEKIAAGPPIGRGSRWRHQLAVAPFAPDGSLELAAVLTPHIGGVVEFYRLEANELKIVAQIPGYTSHMLGTRNLDLAAAGDFDGDGRHELLLPNQRRTELGAIRRTAEGATVAWTVPLDGVLSTNVAAVTLPGGRLAVGVGRDDGMLRVWGP